MTLKRSADRQRDSDISIQVFLRHRNSTAIVLNLRQTDCEPLNTVFFTRPEWLGGDRLFNGQYLFDNVILHRYEEDPPDKRSGYPQDIEGIRSSFFKGRLQFGDLRPCEN